jgi:hypothetical protein
VYSFTSASADNLDVSGDVCPCSEDGVMQTIQQTAEAYCEAVG